MRNDQNDFFHTQQQYALEEQFSHQFSILFPEKTMIKIRKKGFTLVELMVSMAIFAILLTSLLSVVHNIFLARIKSMNRISLTEQLYQFSEDFFSAIKK